MKIITFANLKGGCAKTTVTTTIASILALEKQKKVLIIDFDPQGNTSSLFEIDETLSDYTSLYDIFENININPQEVVISNATSWANNIDIIGSSILLTGTERKLISLSAREFYFRRYLHKNKDFFNKYDYILCDTAPAMSCINENCFAVADKIIFCSEIGVGSYKGIELFNFLWDEIRVNLEIPNNIKGLILSKYDDVSNASKDYLAFLKESEMTKDILFNNVIHNTIKFKDSEANNLPITLAYPTNRATDDYRKLVDEMINKGVL